MKTAAENVFWEVADCSRALGVTPSSIRLYVRKNQLIPAAKTPRGVCLFRPSDVQVFQEARKARATTRK